MTVVVTVTSARRPLSPRGVIFMRYVEHREAKLHNLTASPRRGTRFRDLGLEHLHLLGLRSKAFAAHWKWCVFSDRRWSAAGPRRETRGPTYANEHAETVKSTDNGDLEGSSRRSNPGVTRT